MKKLYCLLMGLFIITSLTACSESDYDSDDGYYSDDYDEDYDDDDYDEDDYDSSDLDMPEAYDYVIDQYVEACEIDADSWYEDSSVYLDDYPDVNGFIMDEYQSSKGDDEYPMSLYYGLIDIDGDDVLELLIAHDNANSYIVPFALFTYDGDIAIDTAICSPGCDGGSIAVYKNGIIEVSYAEATDYYKLSDNGFDVETASSKGKNAGSDLTEDLDWELIATSDSNNGAHDDADSDDDYSDEDADSDEDLCYLPDGAYDSIYNCTEIYNRSKTSMIKSFTPVDDDKVLIDGDFYEYLEDNSDDIYGEYYSDDTRLLKLSDSCVYGGLDDHFWEYSKEEFFDIKSGISVTFEVENGEIVKMYYGC